MFDLQQCATMACMLDIISPKPGNVHRGADFEDATFLDFAASAIAIGPHIARAAEQPLGKTILDAITSTREVTSTNTNLGIVLVLAPLAAVAHCTDRVAGIEDLFRSLTRDDASDVFEAIRLAKAGSLGASCELDVNDVRSQPTDLLHAMELARDRDRIASLYVTRFEYVFDHLAPAIQSRGNSYGVVDAIISTYIDEMSRYPDTLIARKCGRELAVESAARAGRVAKLTPASGENWSNALADLDFWLRSDGNRRNPGTTADILTGGVFIALLDGLKIGGIQ